VGHILCEAVSRNLVVVVVVVVVVVGGGSMLVLLVDEMMVSKISVHGDYWV
jgi:hypothetical protein